MDQTNASLAYIIKDNKILLAKKKVGFAIGKFCSVGGKAEKGESSKQTLIREMREEIDVIPSKVNLVANIIFNKENKQITNMDVYIVSDFLGQPKETEEVSPHWFSLDNIPYSHMFPEDAIWLPYVLRGEKIKATFEYKGNFELISYTLEELK